MAHQDHRTGSGLGQMHSNAISFHKSMRNSHCSAPVSSTRLRLGFIGVDCLGMALNGPTLPVWRCPLFGEDRKSRFGAVRTTVDPYATLVTPNIFRRMAL